MQNITKILGFLMVVIYIAAGLFFLLVSEYLDMNANLRIGFGSIVLLYGLYRAYQIYTYVNAPKDKEGEEETIEN